jgi:hypothetical protein
MGRTGRLTLSQTSDVLGVSIHRTRQLVRDGFLHPVRTPGQPFGGEQYFDEEEVSALRDAREQKTGDLFKVSATALQSFALSRQVERRLETLETLLGLRTLRLDLGDESVRELWLSAKDDLDKSITGTEQVRSWAESFTMMDELFFERVRQVTGDDEPWKVFLDLARKLTLLEDHAKTGHDRDLKIAYTQLEVSRRNLRSAMFLYLRNHFGRTRAFQALPDLYDDVHRQVMLLATD